MLALKTTTLIRKILLICLRFLLMRLRIYMVVIQVVLGILSFRLKILETVRIQHMQGIQAFLISIFIIQVPRDRFLQQ